MARLTKQQTETEDQPDLRMPTARDVRALLNEMATEAGYDSRWAGFFMEEVCSPCHRFETPQKRASGAWDYPYRERMVISMRAYIQMSESSRGAIHRAAEDGVKWRGEDIEALMTICAETLKMREIGRDEFIQQAKEITGIGK